MFFFVSIIFVSLAAFSTSQPENLFNQTSVNSSETLRGYFEYCNNTNDCVQGLQCISSGDEIEHLCFKTNVSVGEYCWLTEECAEANAHCINETCQVPPATTSSWGESCNTDIDCPFDEVCLQAADYSLLCLKSAGVSLGEQCKDDTECFAWNEHAICSKENQQCVCKTDYKEEFSQCNPLNYDEDYADLMPNIPEPNDASNWGSECFNEDEMFCDGLRGLLYCRKDSNPSWQTSRCLKPYAELGETCKDLVECQVWDKNAECNGVCTCKQGYVQSTDHSGCIASKVSTLDLPPGYNIPCNYNEEICLVNGLLPTNVSENSCHCLHPASLWEKCYTDEDCLARDLHSRCKTFTHDVRLCVCHAGFLEDKQCFAPPVGAAEIILYIAIICSCAAVFSVALMGLSCAKHCRCDCCGKKKPSRERIIYTRIGPSNSCTPDIVGDNNDFEFRTEQNSHANGHNII